MMPGSFVRVAVALMLGIAAAAAQEPIETRGAWRLVADAQDFALRTPALDAADTTLSLACRKAQQIYLLEVKSPALAGRPQHEEIRVGFKIDGGDQTWFTLTTGPDGTVPIAHQTPFWIIHAAMVRQGANAVAFTAGDHSWRFSLDGFSGLTESLTDRCGFEPPRSAPRRR